MYRRTVRNIIVIGILLTISEFILPSVTGAQSVPFQISSFSYIENRGDGMFNDQDTGANVWNVCLDSEEGDFSECKTPDESGNTVWNEVPAGDYVLYLVMEDWHMEAGWWKDEPAGGNPYEVSVNEAGEVAYTYGGELVESARFGNRLLEVHGHVARDENGNGMYDVDEDTDLQDWTVYLDLNENGILDNGSLWHFNGLDCISFVSISDCLGEEVEPYMITQHDGSFHFRNIHQGAYTVRVLLKDGWSLASEYDFLTQSGDGSVRPIWLDFVVHENDITPTPTIEPTPTLEPTPTEVEPTPTDEPEVTVTPSPTVEPTPTNDPPTHMNPFSSMRLQFKILTVVREHMFRQFVQMLHSQFDW